jgi:DNA-binding LytR/AlgR family response regulator
MKGVKMKTVLVCKWDGSQLGEEAEWLNINELVYVKTGSTKKEKHFYVFGTNKGEYRVCTSIDKTIALLENEEGFLRVDRGAMANLNRDFRYDPQLDILKYTMSDGQSDYITVAGKYIKAVKNYLQKIIKKNFM